MRWLSSAPEKVTPCRRRPAIGRGRVAGLFLPVGGIACEAVYELYMALIREA